MNGNILITGGAGTLGQAIARTARAEKWDCTLTIYSRDPYKHQAMRRVFPECRYVLGDVGDPDLHKTFVGHDLVIHAAANKHIPECERQPDVAHAINVLGSMNVLSAALAAGVRQVIAISTDKVCHPVNVYGATKLLMERIFVSAAQSPYCEQLKINLCRYGNVIGSNGSVLQVWQRAFRAGEPLKITDPEMSRFWLTENDAVSLIEQTAEQPSGTITIPKIRAARMRDLAEALFPDYPQEIIGLRPGEKMYEELVTAEESQFAHSYRDYFQLHPVTGERLHLEQFAYTSHSCKQLNADEIVEMFHA